MSQDSETEWNLVEEERSTFTDIVKLTDEELAVLGSNAGFVVYPLWSGYNEAEQELARRVAFRGLIVRELVGYPTEETLRQSQAGGDVTIEVREDVSNLLMLRNGAGALIAGARTVTEGQNYLYAHIANDVVVLEVVENDGIHAFAFGPSTGLNRLVHTSFIHPAAIDGQGEEYRFTAGQDVPSSLIEALGEAHLRSDIVFRHVGDSHPPMFGLLSGPKGSWLVEAEQGAGGSVVARPVPVARLRECLDQIVTEALAAAREASAEA